MLERTVHSLVELEDDHSSSAVAIVPVRLHPKPSLAVEGEDVHPLARLWDHGPIRAVAHLHVIALNQVPVFALKRVNWIVQGLDSTVVVKQVGPSESLAPHVDVVPSHQDPRLEVAVEWPPSWLV